MYLIEALRHNVPAFHEDRLTQVVAATFNESRHFQKVLLKFLGVPIREALRARTQVQNELAPSRPDLIIFFADRPYVVIESKVDAKSDRGQQERHSKLKADHYFLIARDPVVLQHVAKKFSKTTWYDFFAHLLSEDLDRLNPVDSFLIRKLIGFGKECQMLLPDKILKSDFRNACDLLSALRLRENPSQRFDKLTPFQALESISLFLERILIKLKDDPVVGPRMSPFVRRLSVSTVHDIEMDTLISKKVPKSDRRELRLKTETVTLEKEIKLKKPMNGFSSVWVRAAFVPRFKNRDASDLGLIRLQRLPLKNLNYFCEISAGLSNSNREYDEAKAIIYDDRDDISFSEFYSQAVKNWGRRLQKK